jgi:hypothetical protein
VKEASSSLHIQTSFSRKPETSFSVPSKKERNQFQWKCTRSRFSDKLYPITSIQRLSDISASERSLSCSRAEMWMERRAKARSVEKAPARKAREHAAVRAKGQEHEMKKARAPPSLPPPHHRAEKITHPILRSVEKHQAAKKSIW